MNDLQRDRIRKDLGRATCDEIQEVLNRRAQLAHGVLDTPDMAVMFYEIAVSVGMGAMTFAVQHAKDDQDAAELAGNLAGQIGAELALQIPPILAAAAALNAGGGFAAASAAAKAAGARHG